MPAKIAILHYSVAPVVGGVETVIQAHASLFLEAGYSVTLVAGRGEAEAVPSGAELELIPLMDSKHPTILQASQELETNVLPADLEKLTADLQSHLASFLTDFDVIIVHNIFTKHFNLPLTLALTNLLEKGRLPRCVAWCHDITWTSPNSKSKVHPGYPWDALRTYHPNLTYVAVSHARQEDLAGLLEVPPTKIHVIHNGVNPAGLLGLSSEGESLSRRLGVWESEFVLLLPVRVTQAKNIEFALQTVAALKAGGVQPLLVVTGPPDPHDRASMDYFHRLQQLRRELQVEKEARFVYDSGPEIGEAYVIEEALVGELFRMSDMLFMPSHREGFGMPILEAGLVGLPVICAGFPAAQEIGRGDVIMYPPNGSAEEVAGVIKNWIDSSPQYRLRQRVRTGYTWKAIFEGQILPLLRGD